MAFIDKDAVEALNKAVGDALRPLGVTVAMDPTITYDPGQNAVVMQIIAMVGDSAFEKMGMTDDQRKARQEMNQLAKEQHENRVESIVEDTKKELERMIKGDDIFEDALAAPCPEAEDGQHNLHMVEGFCITCRAGLEE